MNSCRRDIDELYTVLAHIAEDEFSDIVEPGRDKKGPAAPTHR